MYSPRISFMYLDTLLMLKISKFYTIGFSQIWFFYHLKIFKSYEFSQNLKVVAQKLCPPRIFKDSYIGWPRLVVKKKLFSKFSFPVKDTKKLIKHHFFVYQRSIFDQSLKGVAQKLRLPRPSEAQN